MIDPDFGFDDFEDGFDDPGDDASEDFFDERNFEGEDFSHSHEHSEEESLFREIEEEIQNIRTESMGAAFAFAEMIAGNDEERYSLNERTDQENWNEAIRLESLRGSGKRRKKLRPFEEMINDILDGKRGLFDK
jgi:hypothetical protein